MLKNHILNLHIDHAIKESLEIKVTLDSNVIFNKLIDSINKMPPIVYSQTFKIDKKIHTIEFIDMTRNIQEKKLFTSEEVKTIIIKTRKDVLDNCHIVLCKENTPIK